MPVTMLLQFLFYSFYGHIFSDVNLDCMPKSIANLFIFSSCFVLVFGSGTATLDCRPYASDHAPAVSLWLIMYRENDSFFGVWI
jgi:hypothetical protein